MDWFLCNVFVERKDAVYNSEKGLNLLPNPDHISWYKDTDCSFMYDLMEDNVGRPNIK